MSKARGLADLGNAYSDGALSNRNLIINGAMQVAQRGTSATGLTSSGYRTVDRFREAMGSLGTFTVTQSTDAPNGFATSLKYECTTAQASPPASSWQILEHRIEGFNLQGVAKGTPDAKELTLSFWCKSNKAGDIQVNLFDLDNNRINSRVVSINSANTWEYKTKTFDADTVGVFDNDNAGSLRLEIFLDSGSNYTTGTTPSTWEASATADRGVGTTLAIADTVGNTFQITGVQLEVGDTATPFEHRSYGDELQRCQRYFERQTFSGGYQFVCNSINTTTTQVEGFIPFGVEKRASPTVTSSASSTWRVNALSNDATASGINWFTGTPYGVRGQWTRGSGTHTIRDASYVNVENASPNEAYVNIDAEL